MQIAKNFITVVIGVRLEGSASFSCWLKSDWWRAWKKSAMFGWGLVERGKKSAMLDGGGGDVIFLPISCQKNWKRK